MRNPFKTVRCENCDNIRILKHYKDDKISKYAFAKCIAYVLIKEERIDNISKGIVTTPTSYRNCAFLWRRRWPFKFCFKFKPKTTTEHKIFEDE